MKPKVLLFVKIPPPITGANLMNQYVCESELLVNEFDFFQIGISYKSRIEDVRVLSPSKLIVIIKVYAKLLKSLIYFQPRIVYFQLSPLGIAFYRDCFYITLIKLFQKRIVFHLHGKGIKSAISNSNFNKYIYKWIFNKNFVICLSESLFDDISDVYLNKPFIVNNGIPIIENESLPIKKKTNSLRILFLSNLIFSKGIFIFLDSISIIINKFKINIIATIVGEEAELKASELEIEIAKRNLHHCVNYVGPKFGKEKNEIIKNTDLLIYPTLNDAWGLVILEAMQLGIPVIASNEGAIPEIIDDGHTGYLVDRNRPDQIAEKVKFLTENPYLIKMMSQASREKFLKKYTIQIFELNMLNTLNEVIKKIH